MDEQWFFNYSTCKYYGACKDVHPTVHYSSASAVLVLVSAMMVFFMKGGFLLVEISFAKTKRDRKIVVTTKLIDAFACAFGFLLVGFDRISQYVSKEDVAVRFFGVTDPLVFFYKFTFAASAATIVGGGLVTNRYKLRLPAAFISAFVVGGLIHPLLALIMWSDNCNSFSPYRFCIDKDPSIGCIGGTYGLTSNPPSFQQRMYVLDFAGSGVVHMVGGLFGLVVCLFAKFHDRQSKKIGGSCWLWPAQGHVRDYEEGEKPNGFWEWMYPVNAEENELVWDGSLGVIILWFGWFAFNCASSDSVETGTSLINLSKDPFYGIPATIAVNMIMAAAGAGLVATIIAAWAQVRLRADSVNANEVGNGLLAALVAITAGCPFVSYWGACLIGALAVVVYHVGCWLEYILGIKDTAKVVPIHALCGLWGLIGTGLFTVTSTSECNLHEAFEGLCYCTLRLPPMSWGERMAAQIAGSLIIIAISLTSAFVLFGLLYVIPIGPFAWVVSKLKFLFPATYQGQPLPPLKYEGGCLFSSPEEDLKVEVPSAKQYSDPDASSFPETRDEVSNKKSISPTDRGNEAEDNSDRAGHDSLPVHDGAEPTGNSEGVKFRGKVVAADV
eukprot:Em0019g746a